MDIASAPGRAVRRRREALELTQAQLAYLSDVSEGSIRNLESGAGNPRTKTWDAIQAALGWAPGSLDMLRKGEEPIDIFHFDVLKTLINEVVLQQNSEANLSSAARDLRRFLLKVNERGEFDSESAFKFIGIVNDLGWHLVEEATEYEQTGDEDFEIVHDGGYQHHQAFVSELQAALKISGPSSRSGENEAEGTADSPTRFSVGDRVRDPKFGLGSVVALGMKLPGGRVLSETEGVKVRFDDSSVKSFMVRYSHLSRVEEGHRIPRGLNESLQSVQIIDYLTTTPTHNDENLVVVAMLAKRDPDKPLSALDAEILRSFQEMKDRGVGMFMEDLGTIAHDATEA